MGTQREMKILDRVLERKLDTVAVPPNHRVVVLHPSKIPHFDRTESGFWIVDFGDGREQKNLFDAMRQLVQGGDKASIIMILQPSFIDHAANAEEILSGLRELSEIETDTLTKIAVIPFSTAQHLPFAAKLRKLGLGVYHSADDGACFVEVHRPDGIIVGMAGQSF